MTVHLVEELHCGHAVHQYARFETLTEARLLRVPNGCPDCLGVPERIPPLEGVTVSLLTVHAATCPMLAAMITNRR
jgi:hypothetical protein